MNESKFSKNQNFLLTIACAILPIEQLEIDRYEIVTFEKEIRHSANINLKSGCEAFLVCVQMWIVILVFQALQFKLDLIARFFLKKPLSDAKKGFS